MISLYDYLEYRDFLKAYYLQKKKRCVWFSYRFIANKVGIDASHISKIFHKKRHLAHKDIPKFIKLCKLNSKEEQYFYCLVRLNKAKNDTDTSKYLNELMSLKGVAKHSLQRWQYEFYTKWYHSAILTLIHIYPFSDDFETLGKMLTPPISAKEVRESKELLEKLDLIEKNSDGKYVLKNRFITSGEDSIKTILIKKYQQETIRLAAESLFRHPKEKRNISTVTITIDESQLSRYNEIITNFRTELLNMAKQTENADSVYQLNIQMFPMATIEKDT
ncbi:TIGR02147 family protein [Chitinispirillales bacterium ANBcel5]|uniref:TIGR02147 family protein n=1 Tax=Cellulosispirillum alkaliphilum TaxID=3039283 RepID=UPI002A51C5F7|nr:TIGR02147 family protein [Chitinispirillales bacterium ANBcel5]